MTRVVGFNFESEVDLECRTDDLLSRELYTEGTPVTQYGTDGFCLWVNGVPGPEFREVLRKVKRLGWKPCGGR
jgi:hypothetical protein